MKMISLISSPTDVFGKHDSMQPDNLSTLILLLSQATFYTIC